MLLLPMLVRSTYVVINPEDSIAIGKEATEGRLMVLGSKCRGRKSCGQLRGRGLRICSPESRRVTALAGRGRGPRRRPRALDPSPGLQLAANAGNATDAPSDGMGMPVRDTRNPARRSRGGPAQFRLRRTPRPEFRLRLSVQRVALNHNHVSVSAALPVTCMCVCILACAQTRRRITPGGGFRTRTARGSH